MNLSNDKEIMVYRNEYGKYSVMLRKKNQDNSYESAYIPIQFNKGVELDNKTLIKIKNAWLTFYKLDKDEKQETRFVIRCTEFEEIEQKEQHNVEKDPFEEFGERIKTESQIGKQIEISEEELPF